MPRPRPSSATCTPGARVTSSCGTTAPPCIAVGHGPRTRRGSWCARRSPRPRRTGSRASDRRHGRQRNKRASCEDRGILVAAHDRRVGGTRWAGPGARSLFLLPKKGRPAWGGSAEASRTAAPGTEGNGARGSEGERYSTGTATSPQNPDVREVPLIKREVLAAFAGGAPPFPGEKVELAPGEHRRNLTTLGVPLNHLVGKRFKVGEAVLIGGRMNFPCRYLEKLLGRPVYTALLNRSGLNCRIEFGGTTRNKHPLTPPAARGAPAR